MIARHWRGWTRPENADAYEKLLREQVLPAMGEIAGYHGGYIMRREGSEETEFLVVNFFDSIEAVRRYAGPNYEIAIFEPEARLLLSNIEPKAAHYKVKLTPKESAPKKGRSKL